MNLSLEDVTLKNNSAERDGGGIYIPGKNCTLTLVGMGNEIYDNTADHDWDELLENCDITIAKGTKVTGLENLYGLEGNYELDDEGKVTQPVLLTGDPYSAPPEEPVTPEEDDPEEPVTVAILRDVMTRYAKLLGTAFDIEIEGEDDELVMNCDEILTKFFEALEKKAA